METKDDEICDEVKNIAKDACKCTKRVINTVIDVFRLEEPDDPDDTLW